MTQPPRIWALLGPRTGDNNQVLALAEALGLPFETRSLSYNLLRALDGRILGESLASLTSESRSWLNPPWPDLIIAIGRRSVPIARWIRTANDGRTKLVRIGHPRIDPGLFDLVITTRQYPVPPGDNVLLLPLAMSRYRTAPSIDPDEREYLDRLPRPHLLMAIGGATKYWELAPDHIAEAARKLCQRAQRAGGTLIAVPSPRTDAESVRALKEAVASRQGVCHFIADRRPRFPVLLADADEIFVTGDSVSMLSEAVLTKKPVGLIPIELSDKGRRKLGDSIQESGRGRRRRDLRRFWKHLHDLRLIGSLDRPVSGGVSDPAITAARSVRALLGDPVE
ncbi:MAG TPA: ELM1/GtrOC1 family putative glycosyltransferase [Sphingomicrobium sp.]|nr:ELM1/GtrOC1 family putative glycosyltransferase [Sphingomicrobium sp.]